MSALGGRPVYLYMWLILLFSGISGHYILLTLGQETMGGRQVMPLVIGVLGLIVCMAILLRFICSKSGREYLLEKEKDLPDVRLIFRILVFLVPILAMGAIIVPLLYEQ
jgi:NADH:ubiquinone oxidoreductase subunit 6 (subunit J)